MATGAVADFANLHLVILGTVEVLAVTVDEDPGKDLGALRQPGHRFFFQPEDVETLP